MDIFLKSVGALNDETRIKILRFIKINPIINPRKFIPPAVIMKLFPSQ